jgi:hypothetical protein
MGLIKKVAKEKLFDGFDVLPLKQSRNELGF